MDLKNIDEEYKKSKQKIKVLDKVKQKIEELRKEITTLERKIEVLDREKVWAEQDNDEKKAEQIEENLKAPLAQLKDARNSLEKLQDTIKSAQQNLDKHFAELDKNPELREHLNSVIGKKFSRQVLKKQQEKESLLSKNEQLETIKAAAQKDPYVMNTLKGIEGYLKAIEKIESKTLIVDDNVAVPFMNRQDETDVTVAKAKLEMRRKDLVTYFKGTISQEVIESLTSYDDISKQIKSNIRQSKGIDKQIANYESALENIGFTSSRNFDENTINTTFTKEYYSNPRNLPDTQPKWYQFIKRFSNWLNKRKVEKRRLDRYASTLEDEEFKASVDAEAKENSSFRDAMKYDIIRDYEAKLEQDLLKSAKAERKASEKEDVER